MKNYVFLFVAFFGLQISAQETLLRYNSKVGDAYDVKMTIKQEVGDFMAQTTEMEMSMKITEVSDTSITNESKISKMKMNMVQGQNIIDFDSSKSDDELDETGKMMKAQLGAVLSAVITSTYSKYGEVLNVSIEPNIPQAAQMAQQSSFTIYPKEAVKVGSTWSETKEENGMTFTSNYKVDAISVDEVDLSITGEVSGMANGKISGNMKLDKETGMLINSSVKMDMNVQGMASVTEVSGQYIKK